MDKVISNSVLEIIYDHASTCLNFPCSFNALISAGTKLEEGGVMVLKGKWRQFPTTFCLMFVHQNAIYGTYMQSVAFLGNSRFPRF